MNYFVNDKNYKHSLARNDDDSLVNNWIIKEIVGIFVAKIPCSFVDSASI